MTPTDDERRDALERELQERLARDDEESERALAPVALLCLKCRGICTSDAKPFWCRMPRSERSAGLNTSSPMRASLSRSRFSPVSTSSASTSRNARLSVA